METKGLVALRISLASPDTIRSWSYGEVLKPETERSMERIERSRQDDADPGFRDDSSCRKGCPRSGGRIEKIDGWLDSVIHPFDARADSRCAGSHGRINQAAARFNT